MKLVAGNDPAWRTEWFYEYNYEKQFPYTPNIRGIRTDRWKFIRYPHGDGSPDRHQPELYDLANDPGELVNLAKTPPTPPRGPTSNAASRPSSPPTASRPRPTRCRSTRASRRSSRTKKSGEAYPGYVKRP
jgi:arylsulfatase A-like enzyme